MVVLDVLDEVGQRGEVESAAPEAAGVGEEGGGGDACHGAGSSRLQLYVPGPALSPCEVPAVRLEPPLVMRATFLIDTHLLITHAFHPRGALRELPSPLRDICLHLATCLGVTMVFTRDPGKVIVCTLFFKLSHLKKKIKKSVFSGG